MSRSHLVIKLTGLALLAGTASLCAQELNPWLKPPIEENKETASLTLSPSVCVVESQGELCKQKLSMHFSADDKHHICIYKQGSSEALWCNKSVKKTKLDVTVSSSKNVTLFARNEDNQNIVASATLTLSVFQPVQKRKRRRYGSGIL